MNKVTSHQVGYLNKQIGIVGADPSKGEAYVLYSINYKKDKKSLLIKFQDGNPHEEINGITNEALLAVVEDRLLGFQRGPFSCRENALALTKLQEAMMWLQKRTREREERGVEGKATP